MPVLSDLNFGVKKKQVGELDFSVPNVKDLDFSVETEPIGFLENIERADLIDVLAKFPLSPYRGAKETGYLQAKERMEEGKYPYPPRYEMTPMGGYTMVQPRITKEQDTGYVEDFEASRGEEKERGFTTGALIGKGVAELASWMGEIYFGGVGAKGLGMKVGKEALGLRGTAMLKNIATRAGIHTIMQPTRLNETLSNVKIKEPDLGQASQLAKGWGQLYIENFSELTGEHLVRGVGKGLKRLPFGKKLMDKLYPIWKKLRPKGTFATFADEMFGQGGYSNFIGEIGEERVATILHGIAGTEDFGLGKDAPWYERVMAGITQDIQLQNLLVEATVLGIPGAVRYGLGRIGTKAQKERSEALKANINATIAAIREEGRLTREERVSAEAQIDEMDAELAQIQRQAMQEGREAPEPLPTTPKAEITAPVAEKPSPEAPERKPVAEGKVEAPKMIEPTEAFETRDYKSVGDFKDKGEFLEYIKPKLKAAPHPHIPGGKTVRPYVVGFGCDGSTDANIHYVAQKMCKLLGLDYAEIYDKAYAWQKRPSERDWLGQDLGLFKDEALKTKPVKDTTIIPKNATIQDVLDDLYDINNRSLVEELENTLDGLGVDYQTKLSDIKKAPTPSAPVAEGEVEISHLALDTGEGIPIDFLVAKNEVGKQIGELRYEENEDEVIVMNINVLKEYKRKGIGSALVKELKNKFPKKEMTTDLLTDEGQKFFEKVLPAPSALERKPTKPTPEAVKLVPRPGETKGEFRARVREARAKPTKKPTRKEKLAEEKTLERELSGISRQKRSKLIRETEERIEKSDWYQTALDSVETEAGVIGPGYYYVPEKFRSEVEDIIGKKRGAGTKLQQMFAFKPTDKRIVKLPTGEKAEIGPTDWTRAVQEALGRGREGIEDTTGYMDIADFVQRVKDSFESGEEVGRLNAKALEKGEKFALPDAVMLAEKHRLLRGGATAQQIDDMIREWAKHHEVDLSVIEDEFVGDEALRLKEIKAITDEAERERQLDLLAEENVTKRMRAEAAQAVKEVLKDNDVEAEVREVEEIEEEDLPFERRGKPTGAAVITPSGEQIVLLAYGADSETGYHEGYHILRRKLTDSDIKILDKRYKGNEEAEAADFAVFVKQNKAPNSITRVIWNKLKAILQKIKSGLQGKGFRTIEDIYRELAGGRIALADLPVRGFATAYERGVFGQPIEEQLRLPFKERQAAIKRVEFAEKHPQAKFTLPTKEHPAPEGELQPTFDAYGNYILNASVKDLKQLRSNKAATGIWPVIDKLRPEVKAKPKGKPYAHWRPKGRVKIKSKLIKGVDNEIEKSMKPRSNAVQITPEEIAAKMGALYMPDYFYNPNNPLPEIQEAFNQLVKGGPLFDIRYEREPVFFSKLERLVTDKMPPKMVAEQFRSWAKKNGVKDDELKWSGVKDLTGKITKQQVLDTIAANNIQIEEVSRPTMSDEDIKKYENLIIKSHDLGAKLTDKEKADLERLGREHDEMKPTKFQQYVLPGAERYRELLLRMPEKEQRYSVRHVDDGTGSGRKVWQIYDIITGDTHRTKTGLPSITYEVKRDALERADKLNREKVSIESVVKSVTKITPGQGFEVKMQDGRKFRFSHAKSRQEAIDFLKIQYREGLIDIGPRTTIFRAAHWEETNVLAHVRFDDRTDSEGKKVLFIEEIQSDWHQKGRKGGYRGELEEKAIREIMAEANAILSKYDFMVGYRVSAQTLDALAVSVDAAKNELSDRERKTGKVHVTSMDYGKLGDLASHARMFDNIGAVPDAPFKKTWQELALKRMLRYAVENGYDKIAWTTGEQQAERYDLSKYITDVTAIKGKAGISLTVTDKEGRNVIDSKLVQPNELDNIIGKELADKIRQQKEPEHTYSGLDLKVGGEGMKSFYDRMIPQFLNKYTKKWGGRVGTTKLEVPAEVSKLPWQVYADNQLYDAFRTRQQATEFIDSQEGTIAGLGGEELKLELAYEAEAVPETVPSLAITDAMEKSVMAGQVMFELSREKLERDLYKKAAKNAEKARLKAIGGLKKKKKVSRRKRIKINIRDTTPVLRDDLKPLEVPPAVEPQKKPVKPTYFSDEWYKENIKKQRSNWLGKLKSTGKRVFLTGEKILTSSSTRLYNISPELFRQTRRYIYDVLNRTADMTDAIEPFLKATKKMSRTDRKQLDLALKNSDSRKITEMVAKYKIQEQFAQAREVLDEIFDAAKEVGIDIEYHREYWHRHIKDPQGFLEYFQGREDWSIIEEAIKRRAERAGRKIEDLTEDEKAQVVNTLLRGFRTKALTLARPGAAKERTVDVVWSDIDQFYDNFSTSIMKYIKLMNAKIAEREFFGRETKEIQKLRALQSARLTRLIKLKKRQGLKPGTTEPQYKEHLATTIETWKADSERLERLTNRSPKDTIGGYVYDLVRQGQISPTQEKQIQDVLTGIFAPKGMRWGTGVLASAIYLDTLNSPIQALTQLDEFSYAFYRSPLRSIPAAIRTAFRRSKVEPKDIGIRIIGEEFRGPSMKRALTLLLKSTGFELVDRLNKENYINTVLSKYQAQARSKKEKPALVKRLARVFGKDYKKVLEDLQRPIKSLDDVSDEVKYLLFNEILDIQPIAISEMPEAYNKAGNLRILYTLKTFYIKRMDFIRNECFKDMKSPKTFLRGFSKLVWLSFAFALFGAVSDFLKDWLKGRPFDLKDSFVDNMLRMFMSSKFQVMQAQREGAGRAALEQWVPPTKVIDEISKDVVTIAKGKERGFELWRSVPLVGELYYWWFGRGREKIEAKEETSWVD